MRMPDEENDKLNLNIIEPLTPTDPLVTNYDGYNNSYCYKIKHKVFVHIGVKIDTENPVNAFILPEGYRPSSVIAAVGVGSSITNISALQAYPEGTIYIHSNYTYASIDFEFNIFNKKESEEKL